MIRTHGSTTHSDITKVWPAEAQASLSVHVFCMPKKIPEATEDRTWQQSVAKWTFPASHPLNCQPNHLVKFGCSQTVWSWKLAWVRDSKGQLLQLPSHCFVAEKGKEMMTWRAWGLGLQEMFGIIDWAAEDRQAIPQAQVAWPCTAASCV